MKVTLITDYGFLYLHNPSKVWVGRRYISPTYGLYYADDDWQTKTIYTSDNEDLLFELKDTIIDGIAAGNKTIDIC